MINFVQWCSPFKACPMDSTQYPPPNLTAIVEMQWYMLSQDEYAIPLFFSGITIKH